MGDEIATPEEGDEFHRFGSVHTMLKLDALGQYLPTYTTALKKLPFRLHYIDAFAGTGVCYIKVAGRRLLVPGSAKIALDCKPPFHRMVFIEKSLKRYRALTRLTEKAGDRDFVIVQSDANEVIPRYLASLGSKDRALVFLDPYGMQVAWDTLRALASSRISDVWYLFPLSGLYRQAALDAAAIDADKAAALTRIFGTEEWKSAFYEQRRQTQLFGEPPGEERTADVDDMLQWVRRRLETIFPGVLEPKLLHQVRQGGTQGSPLFALFFAVSNPAPKAKDLALRLARSILFKK